MPQNLYKEQGTKKHKKNIYKPKGSEKSGLKQNIALNKFVGSKC